MTNIALCSGIGSIPSPMTPEALRKVSGALAAVDDRTLSEEVSVFGRKSGQSRASAMLIIAAD